MPRSDIGWQPPLHELGPSQAVALIVGFPPVRVGRGRRRTARVVAAAVLGVVLGGVVQLGSQAPVRADSPYFAGSGIVSNGDAVSAGGFSGTTLDSPLEAMASTHDGGGYWAAAANGGVFAFGDAGFFGSMGGRPLYAPVVGMAATHDSKGYWLVAMDGGIFAFGDAIFHGSMGGIPLSQPVVGMAVTPDGGGYWLVAADGGIFAFGDAGFYGSMGGTTLQAPISGMAATPDGKGYWLVGSDGGVFAFGDAGFYGSAVGQKINTWVTGIAPTHDGKGYWLAAATAGVLPYGDATFYGPSPNEPPFSPTVAIAATPDSEGYWLLQPDDMAISFGPGPAPGPDFPGGRQIVASAASQIGPDPDTGQGPYCNPYGPCEEWCALFATWAWQTAGYGIPRYGFVGDIYNWAAAHGQDLPPSAPPEPGDAVLFGTGPQSTATSVHTGIVADVWPDGAVVTVEGDSGPEPDGQMAVTTDGPFLPTDAGYELGMPVYAIARP